MRWRSSTEGGQRELVLAQQAAIPPQELTPDRLHGAESTRNCVAAFFDKLLRGCPELLRDGSSSAFPQVTPQFWRWSAGPCGAGARPRTSLWNAPGPGRVGACVEVRISILTFTGEPSGVVGTGYGVGHSPTCLSGGLPWPIR